jgi:hypothetical protein
MLLAQIAHWLWLSFYMYWQGGTSGFLSLFPRAEIARSDGSPAGSFAELLAPLN